MAGVEKLLNMPTTWETFHLTVTTSAQEITSSIIDKATVMIQSASNNAGSIYFGEDSTITTSGNNAGGELLASQTSTLPLNLAGSSKLFVIGSSGSQKLFVSVYNHGVV